VPVELTREVVSSRILVPTENGHQERQGRVEVRLDPLTGHSVRLLGEGRLLAPSDFDLEAFGDQSRSWCPFCGERATTLTPRFPAELEAEGRFQRGRALCFPNLATYAKWSSVSIYGPDLHYLPLERMTPRLVADNLAAQVDFLTAAVRHDEAAPWVSLSANHMLPSGSSLFHPHVQGAVDPFPTTFQRLLAAVPEGRFAEYLATEKARGERYLGSTGSVEWLASFAPVGFHELRALLPGLRSPDQLTPALVEELGVGLARALNLYAELGMQSFNLAVYGAPAEVPGYVLNLRLVSRSNLQPQYRSDATYFERVHWTALVDTSPEELAAAAGDRFRS
jgi:UDPglucose--hexose-1-phosphate uridylyltransferase